jgi:enamine deaminase RidA (YjgF/YER057c/UK114 family)
MEHVVYSQVYLANMSSHDAMDRIWREYFPKQPPARAVLGVHRMPTDTPVEIMPSLFAISPAKSPSSPADIRRTHRRVPA